jgi:ribosome modulation factor
LLKLEKRCVASKQVEKEIVIMNLNWLRTTGLAGCTAFLLLSAPFSRAANLAAPQPGYGQDRDHDWDRPPDAWNDIQRRGFHDGIEGARRDIGNNRQPNVENRDEYRHPDNVPPPMRRAYRDAFRRGYQLGISHLVNGPRPGQYGPPPPQYAQPAPPPRQIGAWNAAPDWFNDAQRRGFQEGMDGAQKDYGNHRQPDVNNRWEYQKPDVPAPMWEPYREGFRRGYAVGVSHYMGTPLPAPQPWNLPPPAFNEFQRRGFQDGIDGAQKDFGNHRQPNVENREEYRDPDHVPPEMREAYRVGFRHGYNVGWDHLTGRDHDRY